jgi:hypothetical protein
MPRIPASTWLVAVVAFIPVVAVSVWLSVRYESQLYLLPILAVIVAACV